MGTIATLAINIIGNIQGLDAALGRAQQSLNSMGSSLTSAGGKMSLGMTAPIVGIGTAAVMTAADFEQSMNIMQQVSGATQAQMADLQAQALELGAETSFSAGEAASAMLELAKAGMSVDEVSDAIGGTMDLAAAGGLGLAQAAEIAANTVNAFGLSASDTTGIANMLAAAANASSVEVTDLAAGMTMASAVFASNGQSVEDLTTAMALLGNNAMKGSDAGTSLKTMLMRLTAPTDDAAAAIAALGVNVYDAEGNMRSLPAIMADLRQATYGVNEVTFTTSNLTAEQADRLEYLRGVIGKTQTKLADYASGLAGVAQSEADKVVSTDRLNRELAAAQAEYASLSGIGGSTITMMNQLTAAERNAALTTIFGADAIRAANILLAEGGENWDNMAAAVDKQGAAADVANARMRGFGGAMEYLRGSIDSFLISTALPFLDSLSGIVRFAADAITWLGQLPEPIRNTALAIAAVAAAIGPALVGLGMLMKLAAFLTPALSVLGTAVAALASPIGLVVAAVIALGIAWSTNFMGLKDLTMPIIDGIVAGFDRAVAAVQLFADSPTWSGLVKTVTDAMAEIGGAIQGFLSGDLSLPDLAGQIGGQLGQMSAAVQSALASPDLSALGENLSTALGLDQVNFDALRSGIQTFIEQFTASVTAFDWGGALAAAGGAFNSLRDTVVSAVTSIDWGGALATAGSYLDALKNAVVGAVVAIDWGGALAAAGSYLDSFKNTVVGAVTSIDWGGALTTAGAYLDSLKNTIVAAVQGIDWSPIAAAMTPLTTAMANAATPLQEAQTALATFDLGAALATLATNANTFRDDILAKLTEVFNGLDLTAVLTGMIDSMTTTITTTDWSGIGTAVGSALTTALDPENLKTAAVAMAALIAPAVTGAIAGITWVMSSENWAGFASAVKTSITNIDWGTVGASFTKLKTAITNGLGEFASGLTESFKTPAWLASLLAWKWPALPAFEWPKLPDWDWPDLPKFTWPKLPSWKWPDMPSFEWPATPGWVQGLIDALNKFNPFGGFGGQAVGTSYFGGGWTNVSEVASEVAVLPRGKTWLPRGTQILNGRDTEGALGGGNGVTLIVQNANIRNEKDLPRLAGELYDLQERRRR